MENQTEIVSVNQESSKKGLKKLVIVAIGVAAAIGTVIFLKKRKEKQLNDEYDYSDDSNESEEK